MNMLVGTLPWDMLLSQDAACPTRALPYVKRAKLSLPLLALFEFLRHSDGMSDIRRMTLAAKCGHCHRHVCHKSCQRLQLEETKSR
eukprot:4272809-Amphidinium_carterae.1